MQAQTIGPEATEEAVATRDSLERDIWQNGDVFTVLEALDSLGGFTGNDTANGSGAIGDGKSGG